jgi:hypothetical protein
MPSVYGLCDCCYAKGAVRVRCNYGDGDYVLDKQELREGGRNDATVMPETTSSTIATPEITTSTSKKTE